MNTKAESNQLEQKAQEFVEQYQNAPYEEVSKIIAGMTAIIDGNEAAYESMKKQRWFERIWYGLTGKNKATVEEMQRNRDQLTKFTIKILVKMNEQMKEQGECIYILSRALVVVRRDLDILTDEVNDLAHKLNEKINSVDNYNNLITDIQNHKKYDVNSPLVSFIDIMSQIDARTANDTEKLVRLKDTMEHAGFDFSREVDILTYSEEIFRIPEDKVGRIILFCRSLSNKSRFLKYTCILMEDYFYCGETDRQIVKNSGEAVKRALEWSNLYREAYCTLDNMFNDIQKELPGSFLSVDFLPIPEKGEDDDSEEPDDSSPDETPQPQVSIGVEEKKYSVLKMTPEEIHVFSGESEEEDNPKYNSHYVFGKDEETRLKEYLENEEIAMVVAPYAYFESCSPETRALLTKKVCVSLSEYYMYLWFLDTAKKDRVRRNLAFIEYYNSCIRMQGYTVDAEGDGYESWKLAEAHTYRAAPNIVKDIRNTRDKERVGNKKGDDEKIRMFQTFSTNWSDKNRMTNLRHLKNNNVEMVNSAWENYLKGNPENLKEFVQEMEKRKLTL